MFRMAAPFKANTLPQPVRVPERARFSSQFRANLNGIAAKPTEPVRRVSEIPAAHPAPHGAGSPGVRNARFTPGTYGAGSPGVRKPRFTPGTSRSRFAGCPKFPLHTRHLTEPVRRVSEIPASHPAPHGAGSPGVRNSRFTPGTSRSRFAGCPKAPLHTRHLTEPVRRVSESPASHPCVIDAFIAAVRFMAGEPAKPWWKS